MSEKMTCDQTGCSRSRAEDDYFCWQHSGASLKKNYDRLTQENERLKKALQRICGEDFLCSDSCVSEMQGIAEEALKETPQK